MKVYELLDRPEKWTQGASARTIDGVMCNPNDSAAVCWCVFGAIYKCYGGHKWEAPVQLFKLELYLRGMKGIAAYPCTWNDRTTYKEVIEVLKVLEI